MKLYTILYAFVAMDYLKLGVCYKVKEMQRQGAVSNTKS